MPKGSFANWLENAPNGTPKSCRRTSGRSQLLVRIVEVDGTRTQPMILLRMLEHASREWCVESGRHRNRDDIGFGPSNHLVQIRESRLEAELVTECVEAVLDQIT